MNLRMDIEVAQRKRKAKQAMKNSRADLASRLRKSEVSTSMSRSMSGDLVMTPTGFL